MKSTFSQSKQRVWEGDAPVILSMRPSAANYAQVSIPCQSVAGAMKLARKAVCGAWCISVRVRATGEFGWYDTPERQFVPRSFGIINETDCAKMIVLAQSREW